MHCRWDTCDVSSDKSSLLIFKTRVASWTVPRRHLLFRPDRLRSLCLFRLSKRFLAPSYVSQRVDQHWPHMLAASQLSPRRKRAVLHWMQSGCLLSTDILLHAFAVLLNALDHTATRTTRHTSHHYTQYHSSLQAAIHTRRTKADGGSTGSSVIGRHRPYRDHRWGFDYRSLDALWLALLHAPASTRTRHQDMKKNENMQLQQGKKSR